MGKAEFTFLFTDIEGSTALWEQYPDAMKASLERHKALLSEAVERNGGRLFKELGDGIAAVFSTPEEAVAGAIQAQRALASEAWPFTGGLHVRMALHIGAADEEAGDFHGPTVNLVARLLDEAVDSQVVLSQEVHDAVRDGWPQGVDIEDLGSRAFKGVSTPQHIFVLAIPEVAAVLLARHSIQVGSITVTCEPFNWPRNAWEFLEFRFTEASGPLDGASVSTLERYYGGAHGSVHRGLAGLLVQYVGGTGGPPVKVTDWRGNTGEFAFAPNDGLIVREIADMPGYFTGTIRMVGPL